MFSIITCVVISITAFSTTKKPMKNRKKNRTEPWKHYQADLWRVSERGPEMLLARVVVMGQGLPPVQCSAQKAKCIVAGSELLEAGPSKRKKVAMDKGKGRAKEVKEAKSEPEFRFWEVVEELWGLRQDLRELQSTHCVAMQIANQMADVANDVEDMTKHFVLFMEEWEEEEAGNSENARGVENDGEETLQ